MFCYLIIIKNPYLCKKINKDMTKLINTFLSLMMGAVILACSSGLAFETCYRFTFDIQFIIIFISIYAISMTIAFYGVQEIFCSIVFAKVLIVSKHYKADAFDNPAEEHAIAKQRLALFHSQFELENRKVQQRQRMISKQKMVKVTDYTRNTFIRLGFNKSDVFKICESVEYLINNNAVLKYEDFHITYNSQVTQISLKNFAWNIANQYGLSRDLAAEFVMTTFSEWFKNTTHTTVVKTLRTTLGTHKIEIDEKL